MQLIKYSLQKIEDLEEKWNFLSKTGDLCYDEESLKHGYEYNWNVPPSKCCVVDKNIP